jgi:hypothetical protein
MPVAIFFTGLDLKKNPISGWTLTNIGVVPYVKREALFEEAEDLSEFD